MLNYDKDPSSSIHKLKRYALYLVYFIHSPLKTSISTDTLPFINTISLLLSCFKFFHISTKIPLKINTTLEHIFCGQSLQK